MIRTCRCSLVSTGARVVRPLPPAPDAAPASPAASAAASASWRPRSRMADVEASTPVASRLKGLLGCSHRAGRSV